MIIDKIKIEINKAIKTLSLNSNNLYLVEKSKSISFGDFSTNIAMVISSLNKKNPTELSEILIKELTKSKLFKNITLSKNGFINFFLSNNEISTLLNTILDEKEKFGRFPLIKDKKHSVEYVSANPTGYLHIGHARNAVLGSVILNILEWSGYETVSEYVVNDAGNQMNNLASAVLIRYKQEFGIDIKLPEDSYHGEEIIIVAKALKEKYGDKFANSEINNENQIIDEDIKFKIRWFSSDFLLEIIKKDLHNLGCDIEYYFSEYQSHKNNSIEEMIKRLVEKGVAFYKDGACWLRTTDYGDDKDRVLIKSDGVPTYFAPDIVYHEYKMKTNNTKYLINIWGADHYSYIVRMKAAMQALGYSEDKLHVVCMQMVRLVKDGKEFKMSKRTGNSLTLRDLTTTLGKDVSRWYLVSQSSNNHIDIDVDLATKKDSNNPFYYVQYAYARSCALLNKEKISRCSSFDLLDSDIERELINELYYFKFTIQNASKTFEPYKITVYLLSLVKLFHNFYTNNKILDSKNKKKQQQYFLVKCINQVIFNALSILGIKALESM